MKNSSIKLKPGFKDVQLPVLKANAGKSKARTFPASCNFCNRYMQERITAKPDYFGRSCYIQLQQEFLHALHGPTEIIE